MWFIHLPCLEGGWWYGSNHEVVPVIGRLDRINHHWKLTSFPLAVLFCSAQQEQELLWLLPGTPPTHQHQHSPPPPKLTFFSSFSAQCGQIWHFLIVHLMYYYYNVSGTQIWYRLVHWNMAMCTRTHFKTHSVSLVSRVQSRCVRPFFTSTESQASKSDMNIT